MPNALTRPLALLLALAAGGCASAPAAVRARHAIRAAAKTLVGDGETACEEVAARMGCQKSTLTPSQ